MKEKKPNFYKNLKDSIIAKKTAHLPSSERSSQLSQPHSQSADELSSQGEQVEQQFNQSLQSSELDVNIQKERPRKGTDLYSIFRKLSPVELQEKRREAMKPLQYTDDLVMNTDRLYPSESLIDFPKRPVWSRSFTKKVLEEKEAEYFQEWKEQILKRYGTERISYYEQNLEVWKQLWRVIEGSDILLVVCDSRNPAFHFPPTLYNYIVKELDKKMVMVLNKCDLVDQLTIENWKRYFIDKYPGLVIVPFSCSPIFQSSVNQKSKISLKRFYRTIGAIEIIKACKDFKIPDCQVSVDWQALIDDLEEDLKEREKRAMDAYMKSLEGRRGGDRQEKSSRGRRRRQIEANDDDDEEEQKEEDSENEMLDQKVFEMNLKDEEENEKKQYITIGLIGHPNVGKSSLINSLKGKKFVSVSRSPGHTKHFQHIQLAPHLRLCDCPGLVFPSLIPKHVQVLAGIYSIAQVQEPLSCIRFVAERIDLIKLLKLTHPDSEDSNGKELIWSPWDICESFALSKGFLNAKSGRADIHRGANMILRMVCEGKIVLSFLPFCKHVVNGDDQVDIYDEEQSEDAGSKESGSSAKNEKKRKKQAQKKKALLALTGLQ